MARPTGPGRGRRYRAFSPVLGFRAHMERPINEISRGRGRALTAAVADECQRLIDGLPAHGDEAYIHDEDMRELEEAARDESERLRFEGTELEGI